LKRWVVTASLIACGTISNHSWATLTYKGFNYVSLNNSTDMGTPMSDQQLMSIQQLGGNTVALDVYDFTPSSTSTSIAPDTNRYSPTMASVQHAINEIHSLGMNVVLKPMIDLEDGSWRGFINPAAGDVNTWFTNYQSFIDGYANLAQQNINNGVTMLSVGCELNGMEQYSSNWTNLISNVRSIYNGKLTYSANWSSTTINNQQAGGYQNISWWNKLDEIGIDAYFPLTNTNNPTETQLQNAWKGIANNIKNWRTSQNLAQNVLFTEAGYQATDGANESPAGASGSTPDLQEQADCYQALLSVMSPQSWFDGSLFWSWEPNSSATELARGFTPEDKPATLAVLQSFFLPEPGSLSLFAACGLALFGRPKRDS
jgi:hypothetical protein